MPREAAATWRQAEMECRATSQGGLEPQELGEAAGGPRGLWRVQPSHTYVPTWPPGLGLLVLSPWSGSFVQQPLRGRGAGAQAQAQMDG